MREDRERLRTTFDRAAHLYQDARPDYPELLFDRLFQVAGLEPGDRVLEVGAGSGKATLPLARRGLRITAIEPGPALAAQARANLAGYPVEIIETRFEDRDGPRRQYVAVVAATACHWVDPVRRYELAAAALRPGGHLAIWAAEHVFPPGGDSFFAEIQDVYEAIGVALPEGAPRPSPGELPDRVVEIEASGLFDVAAIEHLDWSTDYDAEAYIRLLSTFSGHIAMPPERRQRLFSEIRHRLALRSDVQLRRGWAPSYTWPADEKTRHRRLDSGCDRGWGSACSSRWYPRGRAPFATVVGAAFIPGEHASGTTPKRQPSEARLSPSLAPWNANGLPSPTSAPS